MSDVSLRHIHEAGLGLIKNHVGLSLKASLSASGELAIGYGHTEGVKEGDSITPEEAEILLKEDLLLFEARIQEWVSVPLNDNQFAALVSFAFNVGMETFKHSRLLSDLNRGRYHHVPDQILLWGRMGGRKLAGQGRRRRDEAMLWAA